MKTLCAVAVLVGGCAVPPGSGASLAQALVLDAGPAACPSSASTCVPVSPPIAPSTACADERWVAVLPSTPHAPACPSAATSAFGHWVPARLFPDVPGLPVPPGLQRYCLYQWQPLARHPPDLVALSAIDARVARRDRDCAVTSPSGSAAVAAAWPTLRADFQAQEGRVAVGGSPVPVRVAVVDSAPDGLDPISTPADRAGHGQAVAELVRELGCSGPGGCSLRIATHLALPRLSRTTVDPVSGGYLGFQSETAVALYGAVRDWQLANRPTLTEARLVVNLSLGWEPPFGGDYNLPESLPAAVQAVRSAIVHADCWGAVVVAAAGNDPFGPDPVNGPLVPAAWEQKPAPTPAECAAEEGAGYAAGWPASRPLFGGPGVYAPLVHAVGGLEPDDTRLYNVRPGGMPRLAAPGRHAVAEGVAGVPTAMLTGSSAAAAVTSGVAASIWALRPELSGPDLMALVHASAVGLGQPAQFCLGSTDGGCPLPVGSPARQVARVSQCAALLAACGSGGARCPPAPSCTVRPAGSGIAPSLPAQARADVEDGGQHLDLGTGLYELAPLAECRRHRVLSTVPWYSSSVCPSRQHPAVSALPLSGPQPGSNPCPLCYVKPDGLGTYTVVLSLDDSFGRSFLGIPVVTVNDEIDVVLDGLKMQAGAVYAFERVELGVAQDDVKSLTVAFDLWDGQSSEVFSADSDLLLQP
ncbi:MAG: S8/S53 family peptidase [Archangiaceae bacterium]|nr:S8/S53 family peptidase [Archangiaceae bacterium]